MRSNPQAFLTALSACEQIKNNDEVTFDLVLNTRFFINTDEVMIRANNLAIETDEILEDDFHYYDEEVSPSAVQQTSSTFLMPILNLLLNLIL